MQPATLHPEDTPTDSTHDLSRVPPRNSCNRLASSMADKPLGTLSSREILVVEDETAIQGLVATLLAHAGYVVTVAATGREAIQLLENGLRPSAVLLDMGLPDLPGEAVLAYLQHIELCPVRIPVAVMSGRGDQLSEAEARAAGADAFLAKPFPLHSLLTTVKGLAGAEAA